MSDQKLSTSPPDERPRMCRSCGAIVGAGETVCPQCGIPLALTAVEMEGKRHVYDREAMRFARAVLTRPYTFTILFLVANIFVFMLMWASSGFVSSALMEFPFEVLKVYGAKLNTLINPPSNQWWRFVTPIFIHVNLPHVLVNMYSLWVVGPYVEKLYGSAKFVVFWVLTGIAGVAASYLTFRPDMHVSSIGRFLFKTQDVPSAGASGALFGLVGVLFVFGIKFRHELPEGFKRAFGTGLLPMILLNLFIGYLGRGFIDNAAHLGGFFAGAGLALFVGYKRPGERASVAIIWHVLQLAALVIVAISFIMVVRNFPNPEQLREEAKAQARFALLSSVKAYIDALNQGERALFEVMNKEDASTIEPAIKALNDAPRLDEQAVALAAELKSLLERAREFSASAPGKSRDAAGEKIEADYQTWVKNRNRWVEENGEKYRIEVTPTDDSEEDADKK